MSELKTIAAIVFDVAMVYIFGNMIYGFAKAAWEDHRMETWEKFDDGINLPSAHMSLARGFWTVRKPISTARFYSNDPKYMQEMRDQFRAAGYRPKGEK